MSKKLPQISSDIPRDLRMFTDRLREIVAATGDDRFVTAKELASAGVVKIERSGTVVNPTVTVNLPPAPQNVTVVGNIQTIVISWDAPTFDGFSMAEIWGNNTDDVNTAHKVGTSPGINYRDPVGPLTSKYYWVRFMNTAGKYGPFASAAGGLGETGDVVTYTVDDLKADLAAGAVQVIAGATNSNSIIKTAPTYMSFQHKDASILGTTAAYTGDFRTALGITSTGIIAGYNNKSTGVWQTTLAMEAATGNLTVLGTIKANSVIQVGAYLGSQTVSSVLSDVSTANSNAAAAIAGLASKLEASSSYVLTGIVDVTSSAGGFKTGSIAWNPTTGVVTSGTGVAITRNGIVGASGGVIKFSIDNNGNAAFKGNITGATGTFSGDLVTSGQVWGTGAVSGISIQTTIGGVPNVSLMPSIWGSGETNYISGARVGIFGYAGSSSSQWNVGVVGIADSMANSIGIIGQGTLYGGYIGTASATGSGLQAYNTGGGTALWVNVGTFKYGSITVGIPDGGTDKYLRNDGTWAAVSALGGGTVTRVRGQTTTTSGLTLTGDVQGDGYLTLGGSLSLTSGQITSGLGYTPYNSTNPSGYITSSALSGYATLSTSSLTNYTTTSDTLTYLNGQFATCGRSFSSVSNIANVFLTTAGSGTNNVSFTLSQGSDRSLKTNIMPSTLGMDFLRKLTPVTYQYIPGSLFDPNKKSYGLIANDVLAITGEESSLVYTTESGPLEGKLAIDYASYVAPIITALKEIDARLTQLEQNYAR